MEPASIRYKNPGAMWGNALARKWGANPHAVTLHDGKGQGNNIAVFPTHVQGICAQLDLWRTSKNYKNKRFSDAIAIWSGHNSVESYIHFVLQRVPGMTRDTVMNDTFWRSPMGIQFLKAQAGHEAGKRYPAPDGDWIEAQRRVFAGQIPTQVAFVAPDEGIGPSNSDQPEGSVEENEVPATPMALSSNKRTSDDPTGSAPGMVASKTGGLAVLGGLGGIGEVLNSGNDIVSQVATAKDNATSLGVVHWWSVLWAHPGALSGLAVGIVVVAAATFVWFDHRKYKRLVAKLGTQ
jgi:hypothetical protein